MNGILLCHKPPGIRSFEVVERVRRRLGGVRTGHTGTLDRFAQGLLILLTGRCTRLTPIFHSLSKEYEAVIEFGKETDTLDPEGRIIQVGPVPEEKALRETLGRFLGTYEQIPPAYSALRVGGRRAHDLARKGEEPDLAPRRVEIYALSLLEWRPPYATVRVSCSGGTYIRALARDIGSSLGTCAYVTELKRTAIGPIPSDSAVDPDKVSSEDVLSPEEFLNAYPETAPPLKVKPSHERGITHGIPLSDYMWDIPPGTQGYYTVVTRDGRVLAFIEKAEERYRYICVLP